MRQTPILVLVLVLGLGGCSVYSPKAPTVAQISSTIYDPLLAAYDLLPDGPTKLQARNRIILRVKLAIDANFNRFESSFLVGQGFADAGLNIAGLGLSSAAGLTSLGTSHLLSVISSGITGSGAIYRSAFYSNTVRWSLVGRMSADRDAVFATIRAGMNQSLSTYTIEDAALDLIDYYNSGSIIPAVQSINAATASDSAQAKAKLKSLHP